MSYEEWREATHGPCLESIHLREERLAQVTKQRDEATGEAQGWRWMANFWLVVSIVLASILGSVIGNWLGRS